MQAEAPPEPAGRDGAADDDPVASGDAADVLGEHDEVDDEIVLSWWQHPVNVVALVVSTLLIAGTVGWMVGRSQEDTASGDVDIGFLHDMRVHHEQAVAMGQIFLDRPETEPGLRTVARTIVMGQSIDIGRMIQLLRDADAPEAADSDEPVMAWMGMAMEPDQMPGLATEEQLAELASAAGAEADTLFAELMIAHHRGGIAMAEFAAAEAGSSEVRAMAAGIVRGQQGEIAEIQGLLD